MQAAETKTWNEDYQALLASQEKRGLHPLVEDNPDIIRKVTEKFFEIFNRAPVEERRKLATSPLFPETVQFIGETSRDSTRPLNYIMFTAHKAALEAITPYLTDEDWNRKGPYGSNFVHGLIAGMEKNATKGGDPVGCISDLLRKFPNLASQANRFGTKPLAYLQTIIPKLESNQIEIQRCGGGGYGGLNRVVTVTDRKGGWYNEYEGDYDTMIYQAREIEKLLR